MQPLVEAQPIADASNGLGKAVLPAASSRFPFLSLALPFGTTQRNVLSVFLFLSICAWFWTPLGQLLSLAQQQELFSHVLLVPLVSLYLLFLNRQAILGSREWSPALGVMLLSLGGFVYWSTDANDGATDVLARIIGAFVSMCWGAFLFCFGSMSFRKNAFALLFLLFMVPLPSAILDPVIGFLQRGSAEAADVLFAAIGIPIFRDGFVFSLSHFTIHVAEECSGIRSFLSLLITSLLAGHWFLKSGWTKMGAAIAVILLAIIKNAFRIVGLALLANYVDPTYITNSLLHRTGGIPLFLLSIGILLCLVWLLRRLETRFQLAGAQGAPLGR
jgi:exosortase